MLDPETIKTIIDSGIATIALLGAGFALYLFISRAFQHLTAKDKEYCDTIKDITEKFAKIIEEERKIIHKLVEKD